jgi:hypothetical protein
MSETKQPEAERTPQEYLDAWRAAPPPVKTYIFSLIQEHIAELERNAARSELGSTMAAAMMTKTMGHVEQAIAGDRADGSITAAMAAMGSTIAQTDPPERIIAAYLRVASEILDIVSESETTARPTE